MRKDGGYWIGRLELEAHPEGGYFRETYRAEEMIPEDGLECRYDGARAVSTAIYFLLNRGQVSKFHRLKSDEIWHFHAGCDVLIHVIDSNGRYTSKHLGTAEAASFQVVIGAGDWFGAELMDQSGFSLMSCTVAPGFEFADFELANGDGLVHQWPEHEPLIRRLT